MMAATGRMSPSLRTAIRANSIWRSPVPDGIYRLKVGVKADDKAHRPIATESWVTVAAERSYSIGIFTNRGRDAFFRGEGFWLGIGLLSVKDKIPAGTSVAVELVDSANKRIAIFQQATAGATDQRQTFIVRIEPDKCLSIAAGHYRVEAKVGGIVSRPMAIDIVDPEPRARISPTCST